MNGAVPINSEIVARDPLEGHLRPPAGRLARLRYYTKRYGFVHAVVSYLGRKSFCFWQLVGTGITRPYLKRWLQAEGPHILNLGGGIVICDRWLTGDVVPRSDVYMDVTRPLPLPDNSIDAIFSEEVIEHVPLPDGRAMLKECHRVLKPGGRLRLSTPDLGYFARRAQDPEVSPQEINDIFYKHEHRHIYSRAELRQCLESAGFFRLRESSYRDPDSAYGYLDSHPVRHQHPPEWSQYWEAEKRP